MQSRYAAPPGEMAAPFSSGATRIPGGVPEDASPISSRPAPLQLAVSRPPASFFEEFGIDVGAVGGSFPDEEALGAGEESERAGSAGNRWPRQETMALLKIRSEMDPAFRDATLKGPLWDDVSRKLGELGYARSAKKCKEKFENVHKYYKRTKEGRAGRQDGKSYRFFSQLEAIRSTGGAALLPPFPVLPPPVNASPSFVPAGSTMKTEPSSRIQRPAPAVSSNTSSPSASDTDGDETEEGVAGADAPQEGGRKRKREREGWPAGSRKTIALFDNLMKQVMERQELMQKRFFDAIEKREQDRMIREEAWKRQEMARLNREYELMAHERAVAATRDAAIISFLEKLTGSSPNYPPEKPPAAAPPSSPAQYQKSERCDFAPNNQLSACTEPMSTAAATSDVAGGSVSPASSSRWPKPEVLALIRIRSGLETRYLEAGPKGALWEEISLEMKRLGYGRNAKRCKEKWENINKYFKKVKESNKKRPEDAKTCPYFHELDSLYRKKQLSGGGAAVTQTAISNTIREPLRTLAPISRQTEQENSNGLKKQSFLKNSAVADGRNREIAGEQLQRAAGAGIPQVFFGGGAVLKKPEDIVRELMGQQQNQNDCEKLGLPADSDTINHEYDDEDEDYDDDEEENDDGKTRFEIQFQRQAVGGGPRTPSVPTKAAATASSTASFLAMVQ